MTTSHIDFLGQEYTVGDTVVYSSAVGRGNQLTLGRVVSFNDCNSKGEPNITRRYDYQTKEYTDTPFFTVTIQPLRDSRSTWRGDWKTGIKKRVNVGMIENIIKVDASRADYEWTEDAE